MTADNTMETNSQAQEQGSAVKSRGKKAARKRGGTRSQTAKRSAGGASSHTRAAKRGTASGRTGSTATGTRSRSARSSGRGSSGVSGAGSSAARSGLASRVLSGVGRAIPLAARSMPDQRMVQRLADERPYMLGALGLGIGAVIGLMLPGTLSSMRGYAARGRGRSRS